MSLEFLDSSIEENCVCLCFTDVEYEWMISCKYIHSQNWKIDAKIILKSFSFFYVPSNRGGIDIGVAIWTVDAPVRNKYKRCLKKV